MKTKIVLLFAFLMVFYSRAQEKPYTDLHMRDYSKKIDSIIVSEKAKMNNELDTLDKSFKENKVSAEEKQRQRAEVAQKYEQIINEKVDDQKSDLEEATKELVKNSVMGKGKISDRIGFAQNNALLYVKDSKRTKKELLSGVDLNFSLAFSNLTNSAASLNIASDSEVKFGNSTSWVIEYRYTHQLGKLTSPMFYRIGLGYRGDMFRLADSQVFVKDGEHIFLSDFMKGYLKNSRFSNFYLAIPIDLVMVLDPKYTTENNQKMLDNSKGNFRVSLGIYGGYRILSQNQIIYKNFDGNKVNDIESNKGAANNFLFGSKISIGYRALNLFVKKDLTPIFNENAKINNKYGIQIGLELLYINF
ncbi:MAG: hypothetical protein J6O88_08230 [Chryseobacterium sp.]|uniref:hypothetical protein n=1 Tax=Chryseobacterium sp. TaxID=1871047 RepID=UPI001B1CE704|nr:hypothetical protein [Chryseobacterium sp.]MBO6184668.1 hypothetical protein [Chryseobacterium sp.]